MAACTTVLAAALFVFIRLTALPPLIESDYCYLLTAAERLAAGHGLTATPPVAPFQPWEWRADWAFLTQWPAGYPLVLAGLNRILGVSVLHATQMVSAIAGVLALVGWFVLALRTGPRTPARVLLGAVTAASALSVGSLLHPSTDLLVAAVLPWSILLLQRSNTSGWRAVGVCGLLAGTLFWFRYAGVFVPAALGCFLLIECMRRRERVRSIAVFALAVAAPVLTLLLVNRTFGGGSAQEQLNLGRTLGFHFTWTLPLEIWRQFTDLGYYAHRPEAKALLAGWPVVLILVAALIPQWRSSVAAHLRQRLTHASLCTVAAGLGMLLLATILFGDKFHFAGLERYYQPLRPLYFILFVAPMLTLPWRSLIGGPCRAATLIALLIAGQWTLQQEWVHTYERWTAAARPGTPAGYWSRSFEPHSAALYDWLREQDAPDLVVASNFHEYIALETRIPAVPIPPDQATMERWISSIGAARGIDRPRVLFVLDPDNRWRSHWIPQPADIIRDLSLRPATDAPAELQTIVFAYPSAVSSKQLAGR